MSKRTLACLVIVLVLGATGALALAAAIRVYFSPNGGCTDAILQQINGARSEILIQAYSFTSQPIARALLQAKRRGVRITAVLDKSNRSQKYSATILAKRGFGLKNRNLRVFSPGRGVVKTIFGPRRPRLPHNLS